MEMINRADKAVAERLSKDTRKAMLGDYVDIQSKEQLARFAREHKLRPDWHEPDEQDIDAHVVGDHLDNAFGTEIREDAVAEIYQEHVVILRHHSSTKALARVNLANLLAWASEAGGRTAA